jgi:hypothetical protein
MFQKCLHVSCLSISLPLKSARTDDIWDLEEAIVEVDDRLLVVRAVDYSNAGLLISAVPPF